MPVAKLFVEGALDGILLNSVRPGDASFVIEYIGNKGALLPRARETRREKHITVCYLRDRDFDHDPSDDLTRPTVDSTDRDGSVLGWRWARHEIESYLLEPAVVSAATGWDTADYSAALVADAHRIAQYTAARWLLGRHRQRVDEARLFTTRPELSNPIKLPDDLSAPTSLAFLLEAIHAWERSVARPPDDELRLHHSERATALLAHQTVQEVLVWHSGKDLLAALAPRIHERLRIDPKTLCRRLRDWIRDHPTQALEHLSEWSGLFRHIAAQP